MALTLLRRGSGHLTMPSSRFISSSRSVCSRAREIFLEKETESTPIVSVSNDKPISSASHFDSCSISPLVSRHRPCLDSCDIELVDTDTWRVSSGLADAFHGFDVDLRKTALAGELEAEVTDDGDDECDDGADGLVVFEGEPDFDEIDNMRVYANLFYKIDRGSKEFEEYSYDFHRKKSSKMNNDNKEREAKKKYLKKKDSDTDPKRKESSRSDAAPQTTNDDNARFLFSLTDGFCTEKKKQRTLTFNQLTAPFHEPFCLDIYISKASVRACVIHRVTSKVVAVAHSISKDMKFDLGSTRNAQACMAVGAVLAQRALADDIHDVVYTPRTGERLEGKLQVVLQAVIDNGVNVKVKLKQRKIKKSARSQSLVC